MWTEEHRRIYRREGAGYPSDIRDAEWARLEPMIPPARPRKTDMRSDAVGYDAGGKVKGRKIQPLVD